MLRRAVLIIPVENVRNPRNTLRLFSSYIPVDVIKFSSLYHRNFSSDKFLVTFMVLYSGKFN